MPKVSTAACASALTTSNQSSHCVGSSWMPLYFMPVCVHVFLPGLTGAEPGFAGSVQLQPASTAGMKDVSTMGVTPSERWYFQDSMTKLKLYTPGATTTPMSSSSRPWCRTQLAALMCRLWTRKRANNGGAVRCEDDAWSCFRI